MKKEKGNKEGTPKVRTLGSKEVASLLGVEPKYLRAVLRASGTFNGNKHSRYEWEENDPFIKKELPAIIAKHKSEHERSKGAKLPPKKKGKKKEDAPVASAEKETSTEAKAPKAKLPEKKKKKAAAEKAAKKKDDAADNTNATAAAGDPNEDKIEELV